MSRKTAKLLVCTALISALALSGCNNGSSSSGGTKESGEYTNPIINGNIAQDAENAANYDMAEAAEMEALNGLNAADSEESVDKPYPTMWEVLPEIEETPVSMLQYHTNSAKDGIIVDGYKARPTEVRIPDTINGLPVVVVSLEEYDLTELILPETTKSFSVNVETIKYINMPRDLEEIAWYKESPYNKAERYYMSPELKHIPDYAFAGYEGDTYTIPEGIVSIGRQAFAYSKLNTIILPKSLTDIGEEVFDNCSKLTHITFPDNLTSIGRYAFRGCAGLTDIT